jgi:hypothetical protein
MRNLTGLQSMAKVACGILMLAACGLALAHVKWFFDYDIMAQPQGPEQVFSSPMWRILFVAAMFAMGGMAVLDTWLLQHPNPFLRLSNALQSFAWPRVMLILRLGFALQLLLMALDEHVVYLTPELAAPAWVRWLQLACVLLILSRRTAWLVGVVVLGLYGAAIPHYGWFHLLDYPFFISVGVALLLSGSPERKHAAHVLLLLRLGMAFTLLAGGAEKFAYPQWYLPTLAQHSFLAMGVQPELAMVIFGFSELALGFALLFFEIGSQVTAALVFLAMAAAVPLFGWTDLVGHGGFFVVLALLTIARHTPPLKLHSPLQHVALLACLFPISIFVSYSGYVFLHTLFVSWL